MRRQSLSTMLCGRERRVAIGNQKLKLAFSTELLIVASEREGTYFEVADKRTKGVGRWRSLFDNGGHKKYVNHSSVTRSLDRWKDGRTRDGVIRSAYFLWEKNSAVEEGRQCGRQWQMTD